MVQTFSLQLHVRAKERLGWDVEGVDPACSPLPAPPTGLLRALRGDQVDMRPLVSLPGWDMPGMALKMLISVTKPSAEAPGRAGLALSAPGSQPLLYPADHTAAQQSWLQMLGQQLQSY